jgi:hypothetical protein
MNMTIQIRRGTSEQWAASSRILKQGEIALDTTLNKIKFGNGTSLWAALPFTNVLPSEIYELSQDAVAQAIAAGTHSHISVSYDDLTNSISFSTNPEVVLSSGLTDTLGDYLTLSEFESLKDEPDGIPTLDSNGLIRDEEISTSIARVASPTFTGTVGGITKDMVGLGSANNTSDLDKPISTATQSALDLKAPLNSPIFTGTVVIPEETINSSDLHWEHYSSEADLPSAALKHGMFAHVHGTGAAYYAHSGSWYKLAKVVDPSFTGTLNAENISVSGNLVVNGTSTTVNATELAVADSLIKLSKDQYTTDVLDIGIYGAYGSASNNQENHPHSGLVRDASDSKWKLISSGPEPVSNVLDFTNVVYDTLKLGGLELTGTASGITKSMVGLGNVDNTSDAQKYLQEYLSDSTQSRTISSATDKFKVIEFSNAGAISVTIPNDTQDGGWQIGSSVEIRQIGDGQITVGKDAAVTLDSPESQVKTRVKWSSLFLEKRAANRWLLTGDTTA